MIGILTSFVKEVSMEGHLLMSAKERRRKVEFECVREGRITVVVASEKLDLSYGHCRRIYKRFREEGDVGLVHRSRGRASNRAKPPEFREAVLARYEECYEGFGPVLAIEKLEDDGYKVARETLRRWLIEQDLRKPRRKGAKHRQQRERRAHFGELVQMDGSHHEWFGKEKGFLCLMDMVDDATGESLALMAEEETTELAMEALWLWCERYGIPQAIYADRKNVFVTKKEPSKEEQLAGKRPLTRFGRACDKLGIRIITARSPQAKGRVERKHAVYQDRFVKELKLHNIDTIEETNELLRNGFDRGLNRKFARQPQNETDFHRPLSPEVKLAEIFCFEKTATVANDWTIRCEKRCYQIRKNNDPMPNPRQKVTVRRLLDGTIQVLFRNKKLKFREIDTTDAPLRYARPAVPRKPQPRNKYKPPPDHPWRKGPRAAARRTKPK
jgi:hypothetical protein